MPYLTNSIRLETLINALPQQVRQIFADTDPVTIAQNIGTKYELTFDEIDTLYGIIADALEKKPPGDIAKKIETGLEEDNKPQSIEIARALIDDFFTKFETVQPGSKPILKQAGLPVKEASSFQLSAASLKTGAAQTRASAVSIGQKLEANSYQLKALGAAPAALDERHIRALARIAAGTTHSEEQLIEQFQTLPEGLKRAITTVDTANAIQDIAKRFLLHIDQMAALASETGLVLLGLTHPRDFVKNLAARLRISEQRALEIAREVSEQILAKVKEALRILHASSEIPNTKYQIPKNQPKPSQISNQRTQELPKKLGVLEEQEDSATEKLPTTNYQLPTSETPYSPGAKWETGEEQLTREEVLRRIENPSEVKLKTSNLPLETKVGPTGWRPQYQSEARYGAQPPAAPTAKYEVGSMKYEENPVEPRPPAPPPPLPRSGNTEYRISNTEKYQKQENQKQENTATPPTIGEYSSGQKLTANSQQLKASEESFLEEKLSGPTGAAHEEKRYTIDPYREPTD